MYDSKHFTKHITRLNIQFKSSVMREVVKIFYGILLMIYRFPHIQQSVLEFNLCRNHITYLNVKCEQFSARFGKGRGFPYAVRYNM